MTATSVDLSSGESVRGEVLDEAMIARLVHAFYETVRADALLGPVFEARIHDWPAHLARMCSFWSSIMLMTGSYHGRPMERHQALPIDAGHFDRWLELFRHSAKAVCPPETAALFVERAGRIAESLELGRALNGGVLLKRGMRYRQAAPARPDADQFHGGA